MILLSFIGIRFKGLYSNTIIGLTFLISSLIYFATNKNTKKKIISIIILFPLVLVGFYLQFFNQNLGTYKVNNELNIRVSQEGFLACGEIIRLTKSKLLIFDKELIYNSSECLRGINKIETIEFNEKSAELLIYHNGEMDSENPYLYRIENKNVW
jgi:ABC-2 type transport system permease protein